MKTSRIVDLSHEIRHGLITYPGLPGPEITDHLSREASRANYAPGTEFQIGRISLVANTGTYLDTPFHRFPDGNDLASAPLTAMVDLEGIVIDLPKGTRAFERSMLELFDVRGRAVILRTGWDRHWEKESYRIDAPFLSADGATWLAQEGAVLVGTDSINIDDIGDTSRPAHTRLLAAGIPIVEHLCGLEQLPRERFRFFAAPPRVAGMGTFPVRAFAIVD